MEWPCCVYMCVRMRRAGNERHLLVILDRTSIASLLLASRTSLDLDETMAHQPSGTTTDANVVVYQFGAAWGLPSLEPASLAAQTYARFSSKADRVRFVDCNNPRISAAGT